MKYYKVVNHLAAAVTIDTNITNYNLTLIHKSKYANLMDFFTSSSLELNLPLNFYYYFYNTITSTKGQYLTTFGRPVNDIYEVYALTNNVDHLGIYVHKNDLIKMIQDLEKIGFEYFNEGYYLWEFIYEKVRAKNHASKPNRSDSFFLFDNKKDCQYYIDNHKGGGQICEVELLTKRDIFKGDMNMLDIIPENFTCQQAQDNAEKYWNSEITKDPVFEYIFQGVCKLTP
ncbi:hypothetical protein AR687_24170 [Flavobacteriaceae bacterium CRH]|nr:hypothetical protein AR687_24170 [Flavobacteriaceae bacterium CRH]